MKVWQGRPPSLEKSMRALVKLVFAIGAVQFFFSPQMNHVDRRAQLPVLAIGQYLLSPAYSAFQDLKLAETFSLEIPEGDEVQLEVGEEYRFVKYIELAPLDIAQEIVLPEIIADAPEQEDLVAMYSGDGDLLSINDRKRLLASYYKDYDVSGKDLKEEAGKLLATQSSVQTITEKSSVRIPTQAGSDIVVSGPAPKREPPRKVAAKPEAQIEEHGVHPPQPAGLEGPYRISGDLLMTGGVAFVGGTDHVVVSHVYGGEELSSAEIRLDQATYEIEVPGLEGFLVVELRDQNQELYGYGEVDLTTMVGGANKFNEIKNKALLVSPFYHGLRADIFTMRETVKIKTVELPALERRVLMDDDQIFADPSLHEVSELVVRAETDDHIPGVQFAVAGEKLDLRLYSRTAIDAFLSLVSPAPVSWSPETPAMIMGRVTEKGQPVAGATVQLLGQENPTYYFSGFFPHKNSVVTEENGLFAFQGVSEGVHGIRADRLGRHFATHFLPTERGHISHLHLEKARDEAFSVSVFDFLTQVPQVANVFWVGTPQEYALENEAVSSIRRPRVKGLQLLEMDAGEGFQIHRMSVAGHQHHSEAPIVSEKFLDEIAEQAEVYREEQRGVVVLFGARADTELFASNLGLNDNEIVFFDKDKKVFTDTFIPESGGAIIYNIEPGIQTLRLLPRGGRKIQARLIVADPGIINTVAL